MVEESYTTPKPDERLRIATADGKYTIIQTKPATYGSSATAKTGALPIGSGSTLV